MSMLQDHQRVMMLKVLLNEEAPGHNEKRKSKEQRQRIWTTTMIVNRHDNADNGRRHTDDDSEQ